ncbi:Gamma-tubulin complex component 5 [Branchiostoma belcheri]|nr:Gamma-tubulin complex component 5 [Branchiostoma belcheri]
MPTETSAGEFRNLVSCYKWHLQNNVSLEQVHEACSMDQDLVELGTETEVVFWLMGLLIIISNAVVLLGIIGTKQLHRPIYIYLANLAITDVFAGIGFLYRIVGHAGHGAMYDFRLTYASIIISSQITSASALAVLSINTYIAVMHPLFFHIHADSAKLRAGVTITVSWIVFSLLAFSPCMGWNCVHLETLTTGICISWYPLAFVVTCSSIALLLCVVMLFTNIRVYVAIRQREKRRLAQAAAGGHQASGVNGPGQNNAAQEEAHRKYEERVYKARTVMIHVVVAFACWLLPLLLFVFCRVLPDFCPNNGVFSGICLNSLINPIATLIRTPDLRSAIWQKLTGVHQTLVTVIRRNRADPQEDQAGTGDVPSLQEGSARGRGHNTPRLAPGEQSMVGNCQEGPAHGEGQNAPRLAPGEQSMVGNCQEGPAHGEGQNAPRLAPGEQSMVGNCQEGPAHGEGQNAPRLAPGEQSMVGNCQEGPAHGEGQNAPRLAPGEQSAVRSPRQEGSAHGEGQNAQRLSPDEQSAVRNPRQEGPAHGEGQSTPRLAPDEQSAVKNRHRQIHTYRRMPEPSKPSRDTAGLQPIVVEID